MPRISFSDIVGIAGIVFAVVLIVLDKAGKLKGHWLFILLGLAAFMTLFIAFGNPWVVDAPDRWRLWRGGLLFCVVVLAYSGIALWISPTPRTVVAEGAAQSPAPEQLLRVRAAAHGQYAKGTPEDGVEWKPEYTDVRLTLTNNGPFDYFNVDLMFKTDQNIVNIVQYTDIPGVHVIPFGLGTL